MNDPNFGFDPSKFQALLETVRANLKLEDGSQPNDFISRHIMLKTAYEMGYGLYPHDVTNRPFALAAANGKEDYIPYSNQYRDYCRFIDGDMAQHTGESMSEFFRRPRFEVEMIYDIVKRKRAGEGSTLGDLKRTLENAEKGKHP